MRLSLNIVQEELEKQFTVKESFGNRLYERHLTGACVFTSAALDSDTLYVVDGKRLPVRWKASSPVTVLVVGCIDPVYFGEFQVDYVCVEDNRMTMVLNAVLGIFEKYNRFSSLLQRQTLDRFSSDMICNYISEFLGVGFIVTDMNMHLLYYSVDVLTQLKECSVLGCDTEQVFADFINLVNWVCQRERPRDVDGMILLEDDRLPCNVITSVKRYQDTKFCLFMLETESKLTRGMLTLAGYINRYMVYIFSTVNSRPHTSADQTLMNLIQTLLEGTKLSSVDILNGLSMTGWKIDDTYCCIVLYGQLESQFHVDYSVLCEKLANQFSACAAMTFRNHPVVIVNLTQSYCPAFDISRRIAVILRDGLMRAGISFQYWSFEYLNIYYQQACSACEMGMLYMPSKWCYLFQDFVLYYLVHYGASRIPPRHLCHPALVKLQKYDQENNTDLRETLEIYLIHNCNVVIAAEALYIHRNTFYQRMKKIQELVTLDLENPDERLYLLFSTKMIRMYEYEQINGFTFPHE